MTQYSVPDMCKKDKKFNILDRYESAPTAFGLDRACCPFVYVGCDPRLISSAHSGQVLPLDTAPRSGSVDLYALSAADAADVSPSSYKTGYKPYADIKDGDVTYYYDASMAQPFISELFPSKPGNNLVIAKDDYYDPMGVYRPHYTLVGKVGEDTKLPIWIRDSQFQRQDLLSRQMWRRNQNSFEVNKASSFR